MLISAAQKERIKKKIREKLAGEPEVRKIVLFGSSLSSELTQMILILRSFKTAMKSICLWH